MSNSSFFLESSIACWRISKDMNDEPALVHSLLKLPRTPAPALIVSSGIYVVVRLEKNRYLSIVTDVYHEESAADISLLMPKLPSKSKNYNWPRETKSATVPLPHILCTVELYDTNGKLSFTDADLQKM